MLALVGCAEPVPDCVDNGQCALGEACLAEVCVAVECLDSTTCGLEQFCDQRTFTCEAGCETNTDCLAGQRCNQQEHECFEYGCRQTDLDCGLGEVCDEESGECQEAPGKHCDVCDDPWFGTGCGNNGTCYAFNDTDFFCIVDCNEGDECARGYECVDVTDADAWGCFAWCPTIVGL